MVREICNSQAGVIFNDLALRRYDIDSPRLPRTLSPVEANPQGLEYDIPDTIQPIHDQLKSNVAWWIMEVIPTEYSCQDGQGKWHADWRYNSLCNLKNS